MSRFDEIMETVFKWEGGFFNHPHDNGGPTNMGITHKVLARWRGVESVSISEVRDLSREEATDIFEDRYWKRIRGTKIPAPLDLVTMDGGVNHGVPTISRYLQQILGTEVTGRITNKDIEALEAQAATEAKVIELTIKLAELRKQRYVNHEDAQHFLRGWRNRLNDVMSVALSGSGTSWTFSSGTSESSNTNVGDNTGIEPDPISTIIPTMIADEDLQAAMAVVEVYNHDIDGLFGPKSIAAMNEILRRNNSYIAGNWESWSNARRKIALGQLICNDVDINAGRIDGLFGPQTEHAFTEFNRRNLRLPDYNWRDRVDDLAGDEEAGGNGNDSSSTVWPTQNQVPSFYGSNPGNECPRLPSGSTVRLDVPFELKLAWDLNTTLDGFTIHRKVHDSAARVFDRIYAHYGDSGVEDLGINLFGGCYNCRLMRGGQRWSMHSWAIAIDFDPARNKLNWNHNQARLARPDARHFWEFWEEEGWVSLGRARDYDWMHVQAARLG